MLEITNKTKSPIQIIIRGKQGAYLGRDKGFQRTSNALETLIIPGLGSGKNCLMIEDEEVTEYINKMANDKKKLISVKYISNRKIVGE